LEGNKRNGHNERKGLEFDFSAIKDDINIEKMVNQLGVERFLKAVSPKKVIKLMGMDWFLSQLSPTDLKELKERLK